MDCTGVEPVTLPRQGPIPIPILVETLGLEPRTSSINTTQTSCVWESNPSRLRDREIATPVALRTMKRFLDVRQSKFKSESTRVPYGKTRI